jgi:hypothetical protein
MGDGAALRVALDLLHVPWRVRLLRKEPLPAGVPLLLRIAAGETAAEQEAAAIIDRPSDVIRQAATFFIEQILFAPEADSYRVLGATAESAESELRRNMASLMTWLHPDISKQGERSVFARRIANAWNDVKTPERRAAYDRARYTAIVQGAMPKARGRSRGAGRKGRPGDRPQFPYTREPQGGRLWRALMFALFRLNSRGPRF